MESRNTIASDIDPNNRNTIKLRSLPSPTPASREEISNFNSLRQNLTKKLNLKNWIVVTSSCNLYVFNLNKKSNGNLSIGNTIIVDIDLTAKVFYDENLFDSLQLCRWPQLQTLLEQFRNNVKREDEFQFKHVAGTKVFNETKEEQQYTAVFEFCAVNITENAEVYTDNVHMLSTETLHTTQSADEVNDLLKNVKIEPSNNFVEDSPLTFKCSDCGKSYDQNAKLLQHQRIHKPHICSICNEWFTGRIHSHCHMQRYQSKRPFHQCHVCGSERKSKISLEKHIQEMHSHDEEFYCDICKDMKTFDSKIAIEWHMKFRHNNEGKNVEHFQLEYVQARKEQIKKQTVDGSHDSKHSDFEESPLCDEKLAVKNHQSTNSNKGQCLKKLKECPICHKHFRSNMWRHMNEKHHNPNGYVCDICGSTYASRAAVKTHITVKHTEGEKLYCDICKNGKVYRTRAYLRKHLAAHAGAIVKRTDDTIHQCDRCNEKFPSKFTLKSHNSLRHSTEGSTKRYQCKVCGEVFGMKSLLTSHEKLHSGILHVCHLCGQTFRHPKYLKKHLKRHVAIPPKKPCSMCDKQYANGFDLRLHMKKVHGVIVEPAKRTNKTKID